MVLYILSFPFPQDLQCTSALNEPCRTETCLPFLIWNFPNLFDLGILYLKAAYYILGNCFLGNNFRKCYKLNFFIYENWTKWNINCSHWLFYVTFIESFPFNVFFLVCPVSSNYRWLKALAPPPALMVY